MYSMRPAYPRCFYAFGAITAIALVLVQAYRPMTAGSDLMTTASNGPSQILALDFSR